MSSPADFKIARMVVELYLATDTQVSRCLNELPAGPAERSLLDALLDARIITPQQADDLRRALARDERHQEDQELGRRLVARGLVSEQQIAACTATITECEQKATGDVPRLGRLLLTRGYVTEQEIADVATATDPPPSPAAAVAPPAALATAPPPPGFAPTATARPTPQAMPSPATAVAPPAASPDLAPPPTTARPTPRATPSPVPTTARPTPRATPSPVPTTARPTPRAVPAPDAVRPRPAPTPRPSSAPGSSAAPPPSARPPRCTFCGMDLHGNAPPRICDLCNSPYHAACWAKAEGCVKELCRGKREFDQRSERGLDRARRAFFAALGGWAARLGAAAILLAIVTLVYLRFSHDAEYFYNRGKALRLTNTSQDKDRVWIALDLHRGLLASDAPAANVEKTVNLEEQVTAFRAAIEKKPDFLAAWFDLGQSCLELNRPTEALAAFQKVLELKPDNAEAMLALGMTSERLGDAQGATRWYRNAVAAQPALVPAHLALAILCDRKLPELQDEALAEYGQVHDHRPEDLIVVGRMVAILLGRRNYAEARAIIDQAEKVNADSIELKLRRAQVLCATAPADPGARSNYEHALANAETVLQKGDPAQAAEAAKVQLLALVALERRQEAYVVARKLAESSTDAEVLACAGRLAISAADADSAISFLRRSAASARKPETLEALGDLLLLLHRGAEAREAFETVRSLNSSYPRINFKIGLALADTPERQRALASIRELIARVPDDPGLRAVEARLMREGGDARGCLALLEALGDAGAASSYVRLQLGITRRELGNVIGALGSFRAAIAIGSDPEALFEIGLTYAALKQDAAAQDSLAQYVAQVPLGPRRDRARSLLEKTGLPAQKDDYSQAIELARLCITRLTTVEFPKAAPQQHVTASLELLAGLVGIVTGNLGSAQNQPALCANLLQQMQQGDGNPALTGEAAQIYRQTDLAHQADVWLATCTEAINALTAAIRKRGAGTGAIEEVNGLVDGFQRDLGSGAAVEARLATAMRTFTSLLALFVATLSDSPATRLRLERIDVQRRIQAEFASNSLQSVCAEVHVAIRLADLLVDVRDRNRVYENQHAAVLRRLGQRQRGARTVLDQLRFANGALCELLYLIAADPSLRP